jgi:hypothetical protein
MRLASPVMVLHGNSLSSVDKFSVHIDSEDRMACKVLEEDRIPRWRNGSTVRRSSSASREAQKIPARFAVNLRQFAINGADMVLLRSEDSDS